MAGKMDELIEQLNREGDKGPTLNTELGRNIVGNVNGSKFVEEHVFNDYCDDFKKFCNERG